MSGLFAAAASAWEKATDTVAAYSLPELEVKVREATNSDPWGPTGPQMKELSRATSYYQDMHTVMDAIWRRMAERDKNWRFAYKSLLLIDYILRNGAEQVIPECRRHSYDIQALMSFNYIDENDKDQGINVRERAKHVFELLSDDSRLRDEREKAQKNTGKFDTAISSDSYGGGGGGGYGGYGGGGGGGGRGGEYPGARNYGNRAESGSTYTGGGNPRSANDRFGDDDYAPRRAAASNPSRAPPTHLSDEEDAPRPARAAAAAPAKASTAPKVVIAPVSAPAPAPAPAAPPKNIFDMDFPAPASAPTPASSTSFFPSAPQQQTSFFPSAPAAQQEDFFNPRGAGAGAKPVAPTVAAGNDAFGDFVTAPPPPSAQPTGGPAPKDDGDPWAHATLFKGITNKPEAKAAPSNAPKATLGQLSKAAPATVPPLNYTPGPTVMPTAYPTMASYPGAPVMTPMMAAPMNPMMAAPMGAAPVAYVPAGGYMMQPAYAPGNPALR